MESQNVIPYQERLFKFIIEPGICSRCGACVGVCPTERISFKDNEPYIRIQCNLVDKCGFCWNVCPKVNSRSYSQRPFGDYLEIFSAQSSEYFRDAQDGGVTTHILAHLFELNEIDGAIVSGVDEQLWFPVPYIAHSSKELHKSLKSRYSFSPNLSLIWHAITKEKLHKLAVVGLPCQIDAVRQIQNSPRIPKIFKNKIRITIGLFCTSNFTYSNLYEKFLRQHNIDIRNVKKLDIKQGKFIVETVDDLIKIPLKEVKPFEDLSCKYCKDLTAESADISIGSIGSKSLWNTVIIRTELGVKMFEKVSRGIIREDLHNPDILAKLSKKKYKNALDFSI